MTKPAYVIVYDYEEIVANEYVQIDLGDIKNKVTKGPNDFAHIAIRWQIKDFDGSWIDTNYQIFWHVVHMPTSRTPG